MRRQTTKPIARVAQTGEWGGGLTHWPNTSATVDASSALKLQSVPFSACSLRSSLNDLFPLPTRLLTPFASAVVLPGVASSLIEKITELRGVVVAID